MEQTVFSSNLTLFKYIKIVLPVFFYLFSWLAGQPAYFCSVVANIPKEGCVFISRDENYSYID